MKPYPMKMRPDRLGEYDIIDRSLASAAERQKELERKKAEYLANGGTITHVPKGVSGLNPTKKGNVFEAEKKRFFHRMEAAKQKQAAN